MQGGSTLTQQLIKNFFLTGSRTMERKVTEAVMALLAERHYSKVEILETYLNEIYLGQRGSHGIFGVWEGAQFYFGKEPKELSVGRGRHARRPDPCAGASGAGEEPRAGQASTR